MKVICITEKLRGPRLRWFGNVVRRDEGAIVQKARKEPVRERRWIDVVRKNMMAKGEEERDAEKHSDTV